MNSIPQFLTPFHYSDKFVGRQDALKLLHSYFQACKHIVLIHGFGGVGKTTFARRYAELYRTEYTHILWLQQVGSLINAFANPALFENLGLDFGIHPNTISAGFEALKALRNLRGNHLLIVDNYFPTEEDKLQDTLNVLFALPASWHILFTSRAKVAVFRANLSLDVLSLEEATALFCEHCSEKPIDAKELETLLGLIGRHTLMAVLLAKTYHESPVFGSLEELTTFLQTETLHHEKLQEGIYVEARETTLYLYLKTVFTLASLTDEELWVLKQWTVLPTQPIAGKDFSGWVQDTDLAYTKTLQSLTKKGWLMYKDYLTYQLHPFLQMFLQQELKPTYTDCEKMVDSFIDLIDWENVIANPLAYQWLTPIIKEILKSIDFTNYKLKEGILWEGMIDLVYSIGDYQNALEYAQKYKDFVIKSIGENTKYFALASYLMGFIYYKIGKKEKALPLLETAIKVFESIEEIQNIEYAKALNGLACFYRDAQQYGKSVLFFEKSLEIRKILSGKQNRQYANALNDYATLHKEKGNFDKALDLYKEALQICEDIGNLQHPHCAIILLNLGKLYYEQHLYDFAKKYIENAYSIFLEKQSELHPRTQNAKELLDKLNSR